MKIFQTLVWHVWRELPKPGYTFMPSFASTCQLIHQQANRTPPPPLHLGWEMPSPHTQIHGSMLEPCKLSLILSLFLLTLPSLFFSLITFSICAFFLLLPIAFALFTIHLLSSILSCFPINLFHDDFCTPKFVDTTDDDDQKQESIELDGSEVPRLVESTSSSSSSSISSIEEQEKIMKELEEMDHQEFCRLLDRFGSVQSDGFMSVS